MIPRRGFFRIASLTGFLGLLSLGCSQADPFLARRTNVGSLKTSLAQLEHDNEQYRKQVAELEAENRRVAAELSDEHENNAELASRLERVQGHLGGDSRAADSSEGGRWGESRTAPAGRPARKPPFARIGSNSSPLPDETDAAFDPSGGNSFDLQPYRREPKTSGREAYNDLKWLPVATSSLDAGPKR